MSADERAAASEAGLKILVQGLVEVRRRMEDLEARAAPEASVGAAMQALGLAEIQGLERLAAVGERQAQAQERQAEALELIFTVLVGKGKAR